MIYEICFKIKWEWEGALGCGRDGLGLGKSPCSWEMPIWGSPKRRCLPVCRLKIVLDKMPLLK